MNWIKKALEWLKSSHRLLHFLADNVEAVEEYDFTADYPSKLIFNI